MTTPRHAATLSGTRAHSSVAQCAAGHKHSTDNGLQDGFPPSAAPGAARPLHPVRLLRAALDVAGGEFALAGLGADARHVEAAGQEIVPVLRAVLALDALPTLDDDQQHLRWTLGDLLLIRFRALAGLLADRAPAAGRVLDGLAARVSASAPPTLLTDEEIAVSEGRVERLIRARAAAAAPSPKPQAGARRPGGLCSSGAKGDTR